MKEQRFVKVDFCSTEMYWYAMYNAQMGMFQSACSQRWAGLVQSPGPCPVLRLHAGRAQRSPRSQMGVSFPAIQGGRDLRPPLRAPIWRLIPRKYRQVSPPSISSPPPHHPSLHPSIPPSLPASPRRQKSPVNSKHLYGQGPIRGPPFPEPAQMKFSSLHEKITGGGGEKTENKVKQTVGEDQGREEMRGKELVIRDLPCFPLCS